MSLAPLGRRRATVTGCDRVGAYDRARRGRRRPAPGPRPVLHARRRRALGRRRGRAAVPAPRVLRNAGDRGARRRVAGRDLAGRRLEFLLEDVGPGTHRLGELRAGDGLWLLGPLGNGFAPPRDGRRPLLVGGGVGIAPLVIWRTRRAAPTAARVPRRGARRGRGADRAARGSPPTTGRSATTGLVTDLLRADSGTTLTSRSTRAGRRRCSRPSGRVCAPASRRSSPWSPGMACGFGACFGCVVRDEGRLRAAVRRRARCSSAADLRAGRLIEFCGIAARAPDRQRVRGRSTRSPPGARSATRCSSASRSPRSSPRRSRSRRARATRRRGCGSCRAG